MNDKDMGASADADRAVVNGAGQAVSALRASVPSAAGLTTVEQVRDAIKEIAEVERECRFIREGYFERRRQIEFEASDRDHPWLGKAVVREITKRKRQSQSMWDCCPPQYIIRKERGVVALQGTDRPRYRNYMPSPGEVFVLSATGATAYRLDERSGWKLAQAMDAREGQDLQGLGAKPASAVPAGDAPGKDQP